MGLGPIEASRQALARAGMTIDDIDLVEINEAFAAQVIPSAKHLGIDWDKLNVHGGAIALGHPFGMTGARIMTTLIHGLQAEDKTVRPGDDVRRRRPGHGDDRRAPQLSVSRPSVRRTGGLRHRSARGPGSEPVERLGADADDARVGSVDGSARTTYCSPPLVSAASDQLSSGSRLAGAEALERVDVEPGRLGLGLPQVHEAAPQLGSSIRSGPSRCSSTLVIVTGSSCARSMTSPPSSPSSITTTGPTSPATPPTKP